MEVKGRYEKVLDWTLDKEVVKSSGELNTLVVEQTGETWNFYINQEKVFTTKRKELIGSYLGFTASNAQRMTCDYLKVYQEHEPINLVEGVPDFQRTENLGRNVNSEYIEKSPLIAPDGKTIYFSRDDYPLNIEKESSDIWFARMGADGRWMKAEALPYPINQDFNNGIVSITPDNNTMMLINQYDQDGNGSGGQGFSITSRTSDGWSLPQDVEIEDYYNNSSYVESYLSANGKVLVITCERDDTMGDIENEDTRDIYVCFRKEDGTWTAPKNLGPSVNTTGDETSPFLAADNKTLFFSTNGYPGYGSNDIYVSRRLDDSWTNWSKPENLGMGINTPNWDAYFTIPASGEYAYLVSYKNSIGEGDVFRVKLPPSLYPEPVVLVSGTVKDSKTGAPLGAQVRYTDILSGEELGIASSDPKDGAYKIVLPLGTQYAFRAMKQGYYPVSENLDVRELNAYKEITRDLVLSPLEVGSTIRINNIFFEFNSADLKEESFEELKYLVRVLNDNPELTIELGGHTDSKGSDEYNLNLSGDRAASVKSYLESQGISSDRLQSRGYGESMPVADNETEEGRALNRRVEFKILK
jgi:outer membrane protein OmpA-like peptidoglycan-associated protein